MPKYIQPDTPTASPGEDWLSTITGEWSIYNGSAWVLIGRPVEDGLGLASRFGTTFYGEVTDFAQGVSKTVPNESVRLTRDSEDIVTVNEVATVKQAILDAIDAKISSGITGSSAPFSAKSKIALGSGISSDTKESETFTVPLPYFQDGTGTQASASDCKWNLGFSFITWNGSVTTYPAGFYETSTRVYINSSSSSDDPPALVSVGPYFIIAVR